MGYEITLRLCKLPFKNTTGNLVEKEARVS